MGTSMFWLLQHALLHRLLNKMLLVPSTSDARDLVMILEKCEGSFSELAANDGGLNVDAVYARDLIVAIKAVKRNLAQEVASGVTSAVIGTIKTTINITRGNYMIDEGLQSGLGKLASAGLGYHKHMQGDQQLKLIRGAVSLALPDELFLENQIDSKSSQIKSDSIKLHLDPPARRTYYQHKGNWIVEATYIQTLRRVIEACFSNQLSFDGLDAVREKIVEFAILGGSALGYSGLGLLKLLENSRVATLQAQPLADAKGRKPSKRAESQAMLVESFKDGEALASVMSHAVYEALSEIEEAA